MRSRVGIRLGLAAIAAAVFALSLPGTAATQFGNLTVDTRADGNDGECSRDCTLREAIALADNSTGQWVSIPPGVYRLTLGPIVLGTDTVFGVGFTGSFASGTRSTIVDARGASRAFEVPSGQSAVLAGVTVRNGTADTGGGAYVAEGGQLSLYDTAFEGNTASGRGGAVAAAGLLSLFNSTLAGNRAGTGGGLAVEPTGSAGIFYSTFSGNSATGNGGAVAAAGNVTLQRATLAGNTAAAGGGLFDESTTGASRSALWSTILAGNTGGNCAGVITPRNSWFSNMADDGSCAFTGTEGFVSDPRLAPLRNNGGPTDTHALQAGSPAIDAGDTNLCSPSSPDQRHAPAVANCDIGAFEFGSQPPPAPLPPPEAGETVNVNRSRGVVKVKIPGSGEFFDLQDATQVPVGSTFDTSKGRVNIVAAGGSDGWFYQGVFKLGQKRGNRPLTTMTLTGKLQCGGGSQASAAQKRKKKRRLWGNAQGKFRTKGKHSAATVVGTRWLVEDRCNGTLTRVAKGRVRVRDGKRTIVLRAGQRYFARK